MDASLLLEWRHESHDSLLLFAHLWTQFFAALLHFLEGLTRKLSLFLRVIGLSRLFPKSDNFLMHLI